MIFVRDKGRLCNNILQYGHVYAWGREHGRKTMSMRFAYKYRYFHICHTSHHHFLYYVLAKYAAKWGLLPVVSFNEPDASYQHEEELMLKKRHLVVEGWYARWYDLFLKYKDEILQLFDFDEQARRRPDELLSRLPAADIWLGLHIRRGDYKTWHGGQYFYSDEQYIGMVRRFQRLHPNKRVLLFVCGNDRELDRRAFQQALPDVHICFPAGNPGEDLYVLSQCDYLIGAPSTFTLVASMYRNVPLCWIMDANQPLTAQSFGHFDDLFRHIL